MTPTMGWFELPPNDCCKEGGHTMPVMMSWLNSFPNHSCCGEPGHTTPEMGWLKLRPNDRC